jgi:hypothetical protein
LQSFSSLSSFCAPFQALNHQAQFSWQLETGLRPESTA